MYQIGSVAGLPFIGPIIDYFGRRGGMFVGAAFIVVGTIVQGATVHTHNYLDATHQFMGGRFLLGFGVSLAASAGPMYVVEVSHPAHRGIVTALYNTFWSVTQTWTTQLRADMHPRFTGAIVASGAGRGALNMTGNVTWLLPVWLQMLFSGLILVFIFFMPESPRWQYVHGRVDKCKDFLVKFHGHGNPESPWVTLQMAEYETHLELDGSDKRWWDYRGLFRDRASCYRIGINVMISLWGQWAGNCTITPPTFPNHTHQRLTHFFSHSGDILLPQRRPQHLRHQRPHRARKHRPGHRLRPIRHRHDRRLPSRPHGPPLPPPHRHDRLQHNLDLRDRLIRHLRAIQLDQRLGGKSRPGIRLHLQHRLQFRNHPAAGPVPGRGA